MVNIVLASHGAFAESLLATRRMIFGEQDQITAVGLMADEGPEDLVVKLTYEAGRDPFNQVSTVYEGMSNRSAVNLPILLESLGNRANADSAHQLAVKLLNPETNGI